jgi:hypothetical protein
MSPVRLIVRLDIKGPNLIKGIHLEGLRATGTLTLRAEGLVGQVLLRDGQPVAASAGAAEGSISRS